MDEMNLFSKVYDAVVAAGKHERGKGGYFSPEDRYECNGAGAMLLDGGYNKALYWITEPGRVRLRVYTSYNVKDITLRLNWSQGTIEDLKQLAQDFGIEIE